MPANTPNYGWPYQLLTDPPNGASLGSAGFIAADASLAAEAVTRTNADNANAATISAAGFGRQGSYQDTSAATIQGAAEKKLGQFTFTASASRRYRIFVGGPQNNDAGTASLLRARFQSGATVGVGGGTVALEVQTVGTASLTQYSSGAVELPPGTFSAGTYAVGLFFQGNLIGSGNSKYGNGSVQPSLLYIEDIGT